VKGSEIIKKVVKTLPLSPGVYRMINKEGEVLYVGKAKALKKRVVSYTRMDQLTRRHKRMVSETVRMEIVTTHTETEALLLESNLIKELQPRYNILLKDDKSFPYIFLSKDHDYPMMGRYRGPQEPRKQYFGPFASSYAVDETLILLQKVFMIRICNDAEFERRDRPCLQYHIKRCAAPCVQYVSPEEYAQNVKQAVAFLNGKNDEVQKYLAEKMEAASHALKFEEAARYRDRLRVLVHIQSKQRINLAGVHHADILAIERLGDFICVQVFFFRQSRNYGTDSFFLAHGKDNSLEENLYAFIMQFYMERAPAPMVLLSHIPNDLKSIEEALNQRHDTQTKWEVPKLGVKASLVEHALTNAKQSLARKIAEEEGFKDYFQALKETFSLSTLPKRVEIYDNSHLQGTNPYGVMVVANEKGLSKQHYRKFAIKNPQSFQDDFAMMREVMERRFKRCNQEGWDMPDLLLIDGGLGQLNAVLEALHALNIHIPAVGIAKGKERHAGRERFFMPHTEPFRLPEHDPILHFIQRLRDEAHRFAIGTHRAKREKLLSKSLLDQIPGIGGKRKKLLLHHFGSAQAVSRAGLQDLMVVEGISKKIAKMIYDFFHEQ
jgi:excinuclease ABC subunit C